jgi:phospholipid/cholesterol/gamma-HCH transport system substrate-binding protein
MREIVDGINAGRGTVGSLVKDDRLYNDARAVAGEVEQIVANLREVTAEARRAVAEFNARLLGKEGTAAEGLAADLRQTVTHARDAMSDLAENAEALKRNFFFRGFFNRRGYFDLNDIEVEAYRNGALEGTDRRALRIWIDATFLFAADAGGVEQLTPGGQARIDSAMSQVLRYPRSSPLVVEGYASGATTEDRYVVAQRRAQLVREYVLDKYMLDGNRVGAIALGERAPTSPTGNTWHGVALALFVPR